MGSDPTRGSRPVSTLTATIGKVLGNRNLRKVEMAWVGSDTGELMTFVVFNVYAFSEGGAAAVGVMGLIRTIPAALTVPFVSGLGDRFRRERVMVASDIGRILLVALAAGLIWASAPFGPVCVIAGLVEIVSATFRPAQQALMPSLASDDDELTAANTMTSGVQSIAATLGPAVGGLVLALTSVPGALLACGVTYLWSAGNVLSVRPPPATGADDGAEEQASLPSELLAGFRTLVDVPGIALIVALFCVQTATWGAIQVLVTVLAFDELGMGDGGPGILFAGGGIGGIVGAGLIFALAGRVRLGRTFGTGILLWGLPLTLIAAWFDPVIAATVMLVTGIGNSLCDVAGNTLLQHLAPERVLARVFGVLESFVIAGIGIGAILAPGLINIFGLRGAFLAVAATVSVLVGLSWHRLNILDQGVRLELDEKDGAPALEGTVV
jgi:MFS family permease